MAILPLQKRQTEQGRLVKLCEQIKMQQTCSGSVSARDFYETRHGETTSWIWSFCQILLKHSEGWKLCFTVFQKNIEIGRGFHVLS